MSALTMTAPDLDCDATCNQIRIWIINGDTYAAIDAVRRLKSRFDLQILKPRFTQVSDEVRAVADRYGVKGSPWAAQAVLARLHTVLGGERRN